MITFSGLIDLMPVVAHRQFATAEARGVTELAIAEPPPAAPGGPAGALRPDEARAATG